MRACVGPLASLSPCLCAFLCACAWRRRSPAILCRSYSSLSPAEAECSVGGRRECERTLLCTVTNVSHCDAAVSFSHIKKAFQASSLSKGDDEDEVEAASEVLLMLLSELDVHYRSSQC